ncbi:molybdopterin-binding protein [Parasporobacterium paucivorans]|uniref:Molybdopterin molybdenumtransferase n=1 Tax=Parasporobacterium paucivorans DSM 15970 TaxID=1122934 RepID=A0A1M6E6W4_9FIRM|nr:molybdopterin-binding protein [Parasporobacterium paucivorans]SHI81119.1 molybdenum cofactor synthesis domain-containing protein [Parasporobacterium paucivorans DSM 15970]
MKKISVYDSVGHVLCHDMTRIVKGEMKGPQFKKGHVVTAEDIPMLLSMGKENIFVWEKVEGMVHEDDAAPRLRDICINENMSASEPSEGKIEIFADCDGLFKVDVERLNAINSLGEIIIATRHGNTPVKKGDKLVGTRIIPLIIEEEKIEEAERLAGKEPLLTLLPFKPMKVGLLTTGSEIFHGRIKDTFTPVIVGKLEKYGLEVAEHKLVDDDDEMLVNSILEMKEKGMDLILCTGGMSVDPDDKTPGAIKKTGVDIVTYGAPVLPGAMFLLGYFEDGTPVMGLPGCVMYAKATIFDLVLPRIAAGEKVTRESLMGFGHGGLCLGCDVCVFPNCGFGKGY